MEQYTCQNLWVLRLVREQRDFIRLLTVSLPRKTKSAKHSGRHLTSWKNLTHLLDISQIVMWYFEQIVWQVIARQNWLSGSLEMEELSS